MNQKIKAQNNTLKKTVLRYKKELKDSHASAESTMRGETGAGISSISRTSKAAASKPNLSSPLPTKAGMPSKPQASKMATLPTVGGDLVNINKASVSDLVLTLGLSRDVAEEVVSNRPYRLRGELVAKNVIPKATFDEIKGRITAAQ